MMFGQMRLQVFPNTLPWNTARDKDGDAGAFSALLSDQEIKDLRTTMHMAFEKILAGAPGWQNPELSVNPTFAFGKWKSAFTGLREEIHGCSPVVAKPEPRPNFQRPNQPAQATYATFEPEPAAAAKARHEEWARESAKAKTA